MLFFACNLNAQTDNEANLLAPIDTNLANRPKSGSLLDIVDCTAEDSTVLRPELAKAFLYNAAVVNYQDISLKAGFIELDWAKNVAFAAGIRDSTGKVVQRPVFTEGDKEYITDTIYYNFDTKKARIKKVITQEGDGFLHGDQVKKINDKVFFIKGGAYTTCSHEHPHFRIKTNRTKVISGDRIVTGPAYLEVLDVPTPLLLPFGFFPTQDRRRSGIIIPVYGNNFERGYFLKEGGYYWAASEYFDLTIRGEIFSMGGWGLNASSSYNQRYKYSGNFFASYNNIVIGRPEFLEAGGIYRNSRDFNIRWSHNQDPKARPDLRFSSSVNIATGTFFQNTQQQANQVLTNQLNSNISLQKNWIGKPYTLSVNLRHNQNNASKNLNLTLPQLAFNVNRFFPFASSKNIGKKKWYEEIQMNYSFQAENRINTSLDEPLFNSETLRKKASYGAQHSSSIQSNFKVLKYWTLNPSIRMASRWYGARLQYKLDSASNRVITDTLRGFNNAFDFSANANLSTKVYGQFNYRGKIQSIRHVLTPNIGFSYTPDFSDPVWGYYSTFIADTLGNSRTQSNFNGFIYGAPGKGVQANAVFGLQNTLEMKIRSKNDSTGLTKVKVLEGLSLNTSYNAAAEEFRWSPLRFGARTSAFQGMFQFNYNTTYDFYGIDEQGNRVNESAFKLNGQWLRRTQSNFTTGIQLSADRFKRKSSNDSKESTNQTTKESGLSITNGDPHYYGMSEGFIDFNVPWNLSFNYNITYNKPRLTATTTQSFDVGGDVQLTQSWRIGFRTGYDFQRKDITYTTFNFARDLHCWQIDVFWVPFGFQRSYNIGLRAKANILQDLKLERKRGIGDF